jgi:hypothetical protein
MKIFWSFWVGFVCQFHPKAPKLFDGLISDKNKEITTKGETQELTGK